MGEKKARSYIDKYVSKMQKTESEDEAFWLKEYMFQIFMRPGTTETAIFIQFDTGLHAHKPLATFESLMNNQIPFPISFMYGDRDWMCNRGATNIVKANQYYQSGQSQMYVISDAGHQMF